MRFDRIQLQCIVFGSERVEIMRCLDVIVLNLLKLCLFKPELLFVRAHFLLRILFTKEFKAEVSLETLNFLVKMRFFRLEL